MTESEEVPASRGKISRFAVNVGHSAIGQIVSVGFGVLTSVVLARWLGPDLRGVLAMSLLLPNTLMAIVAGGFRTPIVFFIASGKWDDKAISGRVQGLAIHLLAIMFLLGAVALFYRSQLFPGIPRVYLVAGLLLVPGQLIRNFCQAILSGKHAFRSLMIESMIVAPVTCVLTFALVAIFSFSVSGAILATVLSAVVGALAGGYFVIRLIGVRNAVTTPRLAFVQLRDALAYGAKSHVANLANFLNYRADFFLVNLFIGPGALGIYAVATGLAEKIWLPINNFAAVLLPKSAREVAESNEESTRFAAKLAALTLWMLAAACAMMALVSVPIVEWMYGLEYQESGATIVWLLPGIVMMGYTKILANQLAGMGYPGVNATASLIGVVANIALNLVLLPRWGMIGAAVATSISYSLIAAFVYVKFLQTTKINAMLPLLPDRGDLAQILKLVSRYSGRL